MAKAWEINASARSLENWEKWVEIRRKDGEALAKKIERPISCFVMNRDSIWKLRREKELLLDAQKIKDYQCKCGKSGCPLFWRTTMPLRPYGKTLLAEAYTAPLKLTHENKKLSNLLEAEYIGLPECLDQKNDNIVGAKCFETSVERWTELPYVKEKKSQLKTQLLELQGHIPEVGSLVVVGQSLEKAKAVNFKYFPPTIQVEEVNLENNILDDTIPILQLGSKILRGKNDKDVCYIVEFTPVIIPQTHAREILIANKGSIAIEYCWKKEEPAKYYLPVKYSRNVLTRFFFNKCDGILLPGQSFIHRFMFMSRTSGIFREVWRLHTTPPLPEIKFILETVTSERLKQEDENIFFIENYLNGCANRTIAHDLAQSIVHQAVPPLQKRSTAYSSKFLEKEIFHNINPFLYYDVDAIREVNELYSRYFSDTWNFSMDDLSDMLIEKMKDEDDSVKMEVMNTYYKLLKRLQKKPVDEGFEESNWETLKYDMCYMLVCSAISEMERYTRYKNWGLAPPIKPPGPKGEYIGEVFDETNNKCHNKFGPYRISDTTISVTEDINFTEDEEERIREEELKLPEVVNVDDEGDVEDFVFQVAPKIEFDLEEEDTLPSRRWPERFGKKEYISLDNNIKKDVKSLKDSKKIGKDIRKSERSLNGKEKRTALKKSISKDNKEHMESGSLEENTIMIESKSEILNFHREFVIIHWRHILERAINNITEVIDKINILRGERKLSDPLKTLRHYHSCTKHAFKITK